MKHNLLPCIMNTINMNVLDYASSNLLFPFLFLRTRRRRVMQCSEFVQSGQNDVFKCLFIVVVDAVALCGRVLGQCT